MFDGEKRLPGGDKKRQRYVQELIRIEQVRSRARLRSLADTHIITDGWDKKKKDRVYEAVERYVYGVDEVLQLEGCKEDEKDMRERETELETNKQHVDRDWKASL
jgi:hypothetical protein